MRLERRTCLSNKPRAERWCGLVLNRITPGAAPPMAADDDRPLPYSQGTAMNSVAPLGFPTVRRLVGRRFQFVPILFILTTVLISLPAPMKGLGAEVRALPLPRFVSLKASYANLRVGPCSGYGIEWVMKHPGIPLEIYQQYGNWRRVRDWEGTTGWILGRSCRGAERGLSLRGRRITWCCARNRQSMDLSLLGSSLVSG
ncbi:hypothetical protein FJ471_32520 [Mesorhizobium sp. B2-7-1]|nr:hypothetical protein FJ471_32520 [Mesorhizobium sp. B2-7-1]